MLEEIFIVGIGIFKVVDGDDRIFFLGLILDGVCGLLGLLCCRGMFYLGIIGWFVLLI